MIKKVFLLCIILIYVLAYEHPFITKSADEAKELRLTFYHA